MGRGKRCLVLGGRGFIGSHLVEALLSNGYKVRCFDRPGVRPLGNSHIGNPDFELVEGDIVSETEVKEALSGCDVCFHLVSTTLPKSSNLDPAFDVESNLLGTIRMLSNCVKLGVRKVVFISSGGTVYGVPRTLPIPEEHPNAPTCSYGITKLAIEKYLDLYQHLHGIEYAVLRVSNPYGEYQRLQASQGAVAVFLGKALRGECIEIWGDGSIVRDYIYIADVTSALLAATSVNGTFNVGSGIGLSLNQVLDAIDDVLGRKVERHYLPARSFDVPSNILNINRARGQLGWEPQVSFRDGLLRFAGWIESCAGTDSDGRTGLP